MSKVVETKTFGFVCPYCGKELSINKNVHLNELKKLGAEILAINNKFAEYKTSWAGRFKSEKDYHKWKNKAYMAIKHKERRMKEIRAITRDLYDLQEAQTNDIFREKIKELIGEEACERIWRESEQETLTSYCVEIIEEEE